MHHFFSASGFELRAYTTPPAFFVMSIFEIGELFPWAGFELLSS
jgi:hypothetical protein